MGCIGATTVRSSVLVRFFLIMFFFPFLFFCLPPFLTIDVLGSFPLFVLIPLLLSCTTIPSACQHMSTSSGLMALLLLCHCLWVDLCRLGWDFLAIELQRHARGRQAR